MSNNGNGAGGNDIDSFEDAFQHLDAERTALLRSKQAKLDVIENRHDDLCVLTFFIVHTLSKGWGLCMCAYAHCLQAM